MEAKRRSHSQAGAVLGSQDPASVAASTEPTCAAFDASTKKSYRSAPLVMADAEAEYPGIKASKNIPVLSLSHSTRSVSRPQQKRRGSVVVMPESCVALALD